MSGSARHATLQLALLASWLVPSAASAQNQDYPIKVPQGAMAEQLDLHAAGRMVRHAMELGYAAEAVAIALTGQGPIQRIGLGTAAVPVLFLPSGPLKHLLGRAYASATVNGTAYRFPIWEETPDPFYRQVHFEVNGTWHVATLNDRLDRVTIRAGGKQYGVSLGVDPFVPTARVSVSGRGGTGKHSFRLTHEIVYAGGVFHEHTGGEQVERHISPSGLVVGGPSATTHRRAVSRQSNETSTKDAGGTKVNIPTGSLGSLLLSPGTTHKPHRRNDGEPTGGYTVKHLDPATRGMISTTVMLPAAQGFTKLTYLPGGRIDVDHADGRFSQHRRHKRGRTKKVKYPSGWRRTVWTTETGRRLIWSGRLGRMKRRDLSAKRNK